MLPRCRLFSQVNSAVVPTKVLSDPMELERTLQSGLMQSAAAAATNGRFPFDPVSMAAAATAAATNGGRAAAGAASDTPPVAASYQGREFLPHEMNFHCVNTIYRGTR